MQLHRAFQKAFGVVKEKRVGQDTATSAGRTLNPNEFVEEEFARTGADRLAQVQSRCDACGEVTASICALSRGVACVYSLTVQQLRLVVRRQLIKCVHPKILRNTREYSRTYADTCAFCSGVCHPCLVCRLPLVTTLASYGLRCLVCSVSVPLTPVRVS